MMFRTSAVAALWLMLPTAIESGAQAQTAQMRSQLRVACEADARRLCAREISDEARVTRCMTRNIRSVSARCRAVIEAARKAQRRR